MKHHLSTNTNRKSRSRGETISAFVLISAGISLAVAGFITPPLGEISDSVLWFFAQCLLYAGSVFGLRAYVDRKLADVLKD